MLVVSNANPCNTDFGEYPSLGLVSLLGHIASGMNLNRQIMTGIPLISSRAIPLHSFITDLGKGFRFRIRQEERG